MSNRGLETGRLLRSRRAWGAAAAAALLLAAAPAARAQERASLAGYMESQGFPPPRAAGEKVVFESRWSSLLFEPSSRRFTFNGSLIYLNAATVTAGGDLTVVRADLDEVVGALLRPSASLAPRRTERVVLDPGHGGRDTGMVSPRRVEEKRVTLDLARRVRSKLQAAGVRVYMTRDSDTYVGLDERSAFANRAKADLFVSIHMNGAGDAAVSGLETFVLASPGYAATVSAEAGERDRTAYPGNRYGAASMLLGYSVQRGLLRYGGGADRGVKRARFAVLRSTACPAALAECGFLSNRAEESAILDRKRRDALAEGLARGILAYIGEARKAGMPDNGR